MLLIKIFNFCKIFFWFVLVSLIIFDKAFAEANQSLLWKTSAGNSYSTRFFLGEQINKNNIKNLTKLWTFNSGSTDKIGSVQSPPIFIGDQLLLVTLSGELVSVSPINGKILWKMY